MLRDLRCKRELLGHNGRDTGLGGQVDRRAHFCTVDPEFRGAFKKRVQSRNRFHQTDPVLFRFQSFIDFQEWDDPAVFPEECRHRFPFSLSIHCAFKQNRSDDLVAREGGRTHDAHAHLVHQLKHLGLSAIRAVRYTVVTQSTGRGTTTLIKRGDKALLGGHLRIHFVAGHFLFLGRPLNREVFGPKLSRRRLLFSRSWAVLLKRSVSSVALGDRARQFQRLLLESNVNRSIALRSWENGDWSNQAAAIRTLKDRVRVRVRVRGRFGCGYAAPWFTRGFL